MAMLWHDQGPVHTLATPFWTVCLKTSSLTTRKRADAIYWVVAKHLQHISFIFEHHFFFLARNIFDNVINYHFSKDSIYIRYCKHGETFTLAK